MKLLLDTHTFIWWDSEPARLSSKALALCQDRANTVLLSVASIWEIQIKLQFDRLLIAQANVEGAILVSGDPIFAEYPVKLVW